MFRLDGATPRSQAEIAARVAAVWLTPQMDRLFQEGTSGRRRFLDRLVWALEPGHAREVAAYDAAMAQRNRLLADGRPIRPGSPAWRTPWRATPSPPPRRRMALVTRMNAVPAFPGFPAARMTLACPIAERLEGAPALAVEDWLRASLAAARSRDAAAGSAAIGAHRADMVLADAATGAPAASPAPASRRRC